MHLTERTEADFVCGGFSIVKAQTGLVQAKLEQKSLGQTFLIAKSDGRH